MSIYIYILLYLLYFGYIGTTNTMKIRFAGGNRNKHNLEFRTKGSTQSNNRVELIAMIQSPCPDDIVVVDNIDWIARLKFQYD